MNAPKLDLTDLAVTSIDVAPADTLDEAAYGHGMPELAASCNAFCCSWELRPDWDWDEA